MDNFNNTIGIVRETRDDENRTPIVPEHVELIKKKYPNLKIIVQPSANRCFKDDEYKNCGAEINHDLNNCNFIFGVKEINKEFLLYCKTYLFFSHTYKLNKEGDQNNLNNSSQEKKELLKSILEKKIRLIDYENIRDKNTKRYLGFGRFAGIVGCYNTLNLILEEFKKQPLARAYKINSYERLVNNLKNLYFPKMRILITGDGRVARGVVELIKHTNIKEVSTDTYINYDSKEPIFCNLKTKDYVTNSKLNEFNLDHFIKNPKEYKSDALKYLKNTDIFISAHYWDPNSPKIFEKNDLYDLINLKIIGDITCDINGSVPTTIRSSTIEHPNYYIEKNNLKETSKSNESLSIMAVDNLPSELPRDSSHEFSEGIMNEVMPYLLKDDDGRILNATITSDGSFLKKYNYLSNYINIHE